MPSSILPSISDFALLLGGGAAAGVATPTANAASA